jgi:tetratricopeptide (TPR) repeat protein
MKSPIFKAVDFVKKGDAKNARNILGIKDKNILDSDIVDSLMSFQKGHNYLLSGHHSKAYEPLRRALPIINKSIDSEAQFITALLADFSEGIAKLFSGDAIGAYNLLNYSAESFEKASFFIPDFNKVALSTKAAAHIALARTYLNMGEIDKAESLSGAIQQIYSELILRLDEEDENDLIFLVEANAVQLEFITMMSTLDLNVIDFDAAEKRLIAGKTIYEKLIPLLPKLKDSPIKLVVEIDLSLYSALQRIVKIGKKVIEEKDFLQEEEIAELKEVDYSLFNARSLSYKAQDRGKGYIFTINQLSRFQERLLVLGRIQKKDFINISGPISLISFIILLFSVHLTIRPSGYEAIPYFLGELIISLIVGFGYGALKFIPLIKLLSNATERKKDKIDTSTD